jgi:hypothetical protein
MAEITQRWYDWGWRRSFAAPDGSYGDPAWWKGENGIVEWASEGLYTACLPACLLARGVWCRTAARSPQSPVPTNQTARQSTLHSRLLGLLGSLQGVPQVASRGSRDQGESYHVGPSAKWISECCGIIPDAESNAGTAGTSWNLFEIS